MKKTPVQGRCTAAERDRRVAIVAQWLDERMPKKAIVALARQEWDIAPRTAEQYITRAQTVIAEQMRGAVRDSLKAPRRAEAPTAPAIERVEVMPSRDDLRVEVYQMLREQYLAAKLNLDVSGALKAAEQLAKLEGLNWSEREGKNVRDDVEAGEVDSVEALERLLTGANASRTARGLAPVMPVGP